MRIRRLPIVAAATLVAPALVVLPPASTPATAADPVPTSRHSVDLVPPSAPEAGDADVASSRDLALAKNQAHEAGAAPATATAPKVLEASAPQAVPGELAVVGVTWSRQVAPSTVVQYRTNGAGGWGAWQAAEVDTESADGREDARAGSEPLVVTGASQVQVRVLGPAGASSADAKLSVIDPGDAPQDAQVGTAQAGAAHAAAAQPRIYSRKEWGANESWRKGSPSYGTAKGVIVHHTAGTNNYSAAQVPAILRGIYAFHTRDRGWSDVGYNFLVDKYGRVWEGRYGGINRAVVGAQAANWNSQTMGISVMGDYQNTAVPRAAVVAVERTIAWKAGLHGFDPTAMTTLYGQRRPTIQGHRDVGQTTCPGNSIYNQLGTIRREAKAMMGGRAPASNTPSSPAPTPTPAASAGGRAGITDVLMRGTTGQLLRSAPTGTTNVSFAQRMSSSNWKGYDVVVPVGDFDGDGYGDVVARVAGSGALMLFKGMNGNVFSGARQIGNGWQGMSHVTTTGDFNGDGRNDLVAINRSSGELFLYPGNGKGGFGQKARIGWGWGGMKKLVGAGDWNGDKKADLIGVDARGKARVYLGSGRGGFAGGTALAGSWGYASLVGMPGQGAVLGVQSTGAGHMIRRSGTSGVAVSKTTPNFAGLHVFDN